LEVLEVLVQALLEQVFEQALLGQALVEHELLASSHNTGNSHRCRIVARHTVEAG
jgi:hypothetical protein